MVEKRWIKTSPLITQHSTLVILHVFSLPPAVITIDVSPSPIFFFLPQKWYNYSISISSHPSFFLLHSSFSPSQLSLTLSLPSLCSCLFRLGWDKWERMNTLGAWGSRRAECEGQGEERGGGGVTWTCRDWLVRKIKPQQWWRVMNGSHYEWFAERRSRLGCLEKIGGGGWRGSNGMAEEEQMMLKVSCKRGKKRGATAISSPQWWSKGFSMLQTNYFIQSVV